MRIFKIFLSACILLISANLFAQQTTKKIGVIFNIDGPFKIYKQAIYVTTSTDKSVDEKDTAESGKTVLKKQKSLAPNYFKK